MILYMYCYRHLLLLLPSSPSLLVVPPLVPTSALIVSTCQSVFTERNQYAIGSPFKGDTPFVPF